MDKALRVLRIINQVVWITVGLATLYSIYWFITRNPMDELLKAINSLTSLTNPNPAQLQNLQNNPEVQKLIQQYTSK